METKITEILKKYNYTYQGFYDLKVQKNNDNYIIIDTYENFYYGGQDFDNCLEDLTNDLKKLFEADSLYLDCECIGRWVIAFM